jgi:hypothetical protein
LATAVLGACSGSSTGGTNFPPQSNGLPTGLPTQSLDPSISGSALLSASLADVGKARSFRIVETSTTKGVTTHVDMRYSASGSAGTITNGSSTLHLIHIGSATYVKAPDGFWKAQLTSAQQAKYGNDVHNAWVKVPLLGSTFGQLSAFTDKEQIVGALVKKETSQFVRGPKQTVDGVPSVRLTDPIKGTVVYVATIGTPYPVQVVGGKGSSAVAHFSEWNTPFSVAPPADYFALPSS